MYLVRLFSSMLEFITLFTWTIRYIPGSLRVMAATLFTRYRAAKILQAFKKQKVNCTTFIGYLLNVDIKASKV